VRHAPSAFRMVRDTRHPDFSGWKFFARKRTTHLARPILSPYLTNANTRYELCKIEVLSNTQHFHFNACGARPVKNHTDTVCNLQHIFDNTFGQKEGERDRNRRLHTGPHHTRFSSFFPRTSFWHHSFSYLYDVAGIFFSN
jgi:hypothetical protein